MDQENSQIFGTAWERPDSVEHACVLLADGGAGWRVAAGCTAVPPSQLIADPTVSTIVDAMALDSLSGIQPTESGVRIGATTTLAAIATSKLVGEAAPLLARAAAGIGDEVIRGMATVGGNVASREARQLELPIVMAALDADIAIASVGAERTIGAAELCDRDFSFAGDELIVAIDVPRGPGGWAYRKITTNLDSYGIASLAITVPTGAAPRVVAGLGESIPQRLPLAEAWLADEGKRDDDADSARGGGTAAEVAQLACAELFAIDDGLSTAVYRRRALAAALAAELTRLAGDAVPVGGEPSGN